MKRLIVVALMLVAVGTLVASDALAADQSRDRDRDRDQVCQQDCPCDGPNCDPDCPQNCIQQRDRTRQNCDDPSGGILAWFRWMLGLGT